MKKVAKCKAKDLGIAYSEAEKRIAQFLNRKIPYTVKIHGIDIKISSYKVYPPGSLSQMFAKFLVEKIDIKNKIIADIGAGCSVLGIVLAINGASKVIGVDINGEAVKCSKTNIDKHHLKEKVDIVLGDGVGAISPKYGNKVDIVISGSPWNTIDGCALNSIDQEKVAIYRSFYDLEDSLINSLMTQGFDLIKEGQRKKIFITASLKIMPRIHRLCRKNKVQYTIEEAQDIHQDSNIHYILGLEKCQNTL